MQVRSEARCHGGTMGFYSHASAALGGLEAGFGVFVPDGVTASAPRPALYALAGLTCTQETFPTKSGALQHAAWHRLVMVFPDTSPRSAGIAGEEDETGFGTGAGFYLDATQAPWSASYRMGSYVEEELPALVEAGFPIRRDARGIIGHSMGGHGALVLGLRNPSRWHSVSALAPICNPVAVPWGERAFSGYLGPDRATWSRHDATMLLEAGHRHPREILVDQGDADQFLAGQLHPDALERAAANAGQPLVLRRHPGYDHSYWFIQSMIADHLDHHAAILAPA